MATLVSFHAHPDDESILTGGTLAKAATEGHRVVVVCATRGEHGEVAPGVLEPGVTLGEHRSAELLAAARALGVARVEFLGYVDSGMAGRPTNDAPEAFCQADVDEAAERLARLLTEERADVLTVYDPNGGYGHPDHIAVHHVGVRAAALAGTPRVYEASMNRDHVQRQLAAAHAAGLGLVAGNLPHPDDFASFGLPEAELTTFVDVRGQTAAKRAAMAAHASQIAETSFFLTLGEELFRAAFGTEWYRRIDAPPDTRETGLFDGMDEPGRVPFVPGTGLLRPGGR